MVAETEQLQYGYHLDTRLALLMRVGMPEIEVMYIVNDIEHQVNRKAQSPLGADTAGRVAP